MTPTIAKIFNTFPKLTQKHNIKSNAINTLSKSSTISKGKNEQN